MISALLYLRLTSLQNLVLSRVRRLRQPKYLVGAIVGAAYFYFIVFRRTVHVGRVAAAGAPVVALPTDLLPTLIALGAVILLVIAALSWILPDERAGLTFTEAEIAFLFPAPVRRRTLIYYKLLNSQVAILFTAGIFTLFSLRAPSLIGGNALIHVAGIWLILATLNLHFMGASFVITRLMDNGITPWRRRLIILGLIVVVAGVTLGWLWRDLRAPQAADLADFHSVAGYVNTLLANGPLPWLLLPAKLVLGPYFAQDAATFLAALGPALLVFAAHFLWVVRFEVSFEDASIAKSEKRAARVAAVREGNWRAARGAMKARPGPFRLASTGRPELAFLWKNLLSTFPIFRPRTLVIGAVLIIAGYRWVVHDPAYRHMIPIFTVFAFIVAGYVLFLGPQLARQDLRSDLANSDILKTYPLHGWQVVLGEMLTPIAILSGVLWLVLLTLLLTFHSPALTWLTPAVRFTVAAGLVPILPLVCALQLLVPNAAALLFPAWVQTVRNRSERGIEVIGQRIIFMAGQLLVVALALLPAALGAGLLVFATQWLIGPVAALALAAVAVLVILAAEVGCGLWWLGQRFEAFDLSSELRP